MNGERLLLLADRLDSVDPEHFNMELWSGSAQPCKTAGCALGYATTIPKLRDAGLKMARTNGWIPVLIRKHELRVSGYSAACVLFDIPMDTAYHIFSGGRYFPHDTALTPRRVARRIREVVADAS